MNVGCSPTVYDSTSTATKTVYFISGQSKVITQPFVSDSVNNQYGTSTTSSICGTTSASLTEKDYYNRDITSSIATVSTSTGVPVITFSITNGNQNYAGTHTITVWYWLTSYTSIKTNYQLTAYACDLVGSATADQSYTVFKTELTFYAAYFYISPTAAKS